MTKPWGRVGQLRREGPGPLHAASRHGHALAPTTCTKGMQCLRTVACWMHRLATAAWPCQHSRIGRGVRAFRDPERRLPVSLPGCDPESTCSWEVPSSSEHEAAISFANRGKRCACASREPLYCGAETACWWELTALARHAHPSVMVMAGE